MSDKNPFFTDQLRAAGPVTRDLVTSILFDQWPNHPALVDFGIDSQEHYEALYYPIRNQEISPAQLEDVLGFGEKITSLVKVCPSNPHKSLQFETAWDLMNGRLKLESLKEKQTEEKAIVKPVNLDRER